MGKEKEKTKASVVAFIPALPRIGGEQEDIGEKGWVGSLVCKVKKG